MVIKFLTLRRPKHYFATEEMGLTGTILSCDLFNSTIKHLHITYTCINAIRIFYLKFDLQ